ncbi:hypothetical protein [Planktothrix agardhii]|uniref:hypothetical protein n=1 Tax=Planktothrix agardhii TaxID=1160 RepID=UPI001F45E486|nr:hypothetical protein [Planktothrix agardhii]MCF3612258.1 hypothetical protein [Planktothrix agardhii 1027]
MDSDTATFNITIPAPKVNLTASPTTASEAGATAITLTATAEGNVVGAQTLDLALTGTASEADFTGTIPTQITIPDGSNTGQVTIRHLRKLFQQLHRHRNQFPKLRYSMAVRISMTPPIL